MRTHHRLHHTWRLLAALRLLATLWLIGGPATAATFTVTNTNDSGAGSLRQAITDANATAAADIIAFSIGSGAQTITPATALPAIVQPVTINGNSQPGFAGAPLIELNGVNTVSGDDGLLLKAANCTMKGLIINRCADNGIAIEGSAAIGNKVQGCFIGTDAGGTLDRGNGGRGLFIQASNTTIGGTTAAVRNVIAGNAGDGIQIFGSTSTGNVVQGNFIGTDKNGVADLGNGVHGVHLNNAQNNTVGGTASGSGNVISGNDLNGIRMSSVASGNKVQGNFIGTDVNGTTKLGNVGTGVFIESSNNTVGGTVAGARNVISGNGVHGVALVGAVNGNLVQGNFLGTDKNGVVAIGNFNEGAFIASDATGNTIGGTVAGARNVISANGSDGIGIRGSGNLVQGNFIGTDVNATAKLGNGLHGVVLSGPNNTVGGATAAERNVISGNKQHGVQIFGATATSNKVQGNFLGTDVTGTVALGNDLNGVSLEGAANNTIGGTTSGTRNVISGNKVGVNIAAGATNNLVQGNFIGTDVNGLLDRGNGFDGVLIAGSSNTIGGTTTAERNVISGNDSDGVDIFGADATGNLVQGNFIGTDKNGTAKLGNADNGVRITAPNNTIGGQVTGVRNVISGNDECGVVISATASIAADGNQVQGNFIGLDVNGTAALGNTAQGVLIQASNCTIGGTVSAARNVIAGNGSDGVQIFAAGSSDNQMIGNLIGTDKNGTAKVPNSGHGVFVNNAGANTIGGTANNTRNVISGNDRSGITLTGSGGSAVQNNFLGLDLTGTIALGNSEEGVAIQAPNNLVGGTATTARNVISGNGKNGIAIAQSGATGNLVQGNFIGTDKNGTAKLANAATGVSVATANNTIGGIDAGARNVISGNTDAGVAIIVAGGNKVQGNFIGLDKNGTAALANGGIGVIVQTAANTIGGTASGAGNVISGNTGDGVQLASAAATANLVQGNFIGTDKNGTAKVANGGQGVFVHDGATNTIGGTVPEARNVISGNARSGINLAGANANGNLVQGNFIGLNAAGTLALGNGENGVVVGNNAGADNNVIGGTVAGARNVISGNALHGVNIQNAVTAGNKVQGNFIGLDANGTGDVGNNLNGIFVNLALNTTIGGTTVGARNVISGNNLDGVRISGGGVASTTLVQGNFIGTDAAGSADRGNDGNGIFIDRAFNNTIGGTTSTAGNVISGNGHDGVLISGATGNVVQGNRIGIKATSSDNLGNTGNGVRLNAFSITNSIGGTAAGSGNTIAFNGGDGVFVEFASGIAIERNLIHDNTGLGIDLDPNGVTANDSGDGDTGSNGRQNFPLLSEALSSGTNTSIKGSLNSKPNTPYRLEFFSSADCDPSGNGEGASFLGTTNVTTNASGFITFNFSPTSLSSSTLVTATATDSSGNTSEFSPCLPVNVADLLLLMTDAPDPVTALDVLTYNIFVANNGPALALPKVTDPLPAGVAFVSATTTQGSCSQAGGTVTCTLNSLADGGSAGITIKVRPQSSGTLINTATISSTRPDTNPANNSFTATTSVIPRVDLALSGADFPDPVTVGTELVYTLTVTNRGRRDATGMTLVDDLPASVTFLSASPAPTTRVGQRLTFHLGPLVVGVSHSVTIRVRPTTPGSITNHANVTIAPTEGDPDPSNNSATQTTEVISCARDATSQMRVTRGTVQPTGSYSECLYGHCRWQQTVTLENHGATPIVGPLALVLDNLGSGVTLTNSSGVTECSGLSGSPFVTAPGGLTPGATMGVTLEFEAAHAADIRYAARVLAGPGEK